MCMSEMAPKQPTVAVVDDDPSIVRVVCEILADENYHAVSCPWGGRALPCIEATHPDLVLLDVQMPDVDGITIFRRMRADPRMQTIPVIFFTANAYRVTEQLPDYRARGAALLPKPFQINEFLDLLERLLPPEG